MLIYLALKYPFVSTQYILSYLVYTTPLTLCLFYSTLITPIQTTIHYYIQIYSIVSNLLYSTYPVYTIPFN